MTKLIPMFLICMVLAYTSDRTSVYDFDNLGYVRKDKFFCFILLIIMIAFAGLRIRYNDTATYIIGYQSLNVSGNIIQDIDWMIGSNPGFQFVNYIMKAIGLSSYSFIMIYAIVTEGLYFWFVRKYSDNIMLPIFILITGGVYLFSFAAIKQCVAIAISLIGIDKAINKKWAQFIVWILIATTFHTYALMFFVVPFLMFVPWTKKTYFMLALFAVIGLSFQFMLGRVLSITSLLGENYDSSSFIGEGVNLFRLLVTWAPIILAFIARNKIKLSDDRAANLILNLSMINAEIMFIARFGTAFYLTRVANYFSIFQVIAIPWLLRYYNKESQKLLKIAITVGFSGYAYYAYGVNRSFDYMYESITIWHYLTNIFG